MPLHNPSRRRSPSLRADTHLLSSYHWHDWIYGIMWFSSPLFATKSASVQCSPTSDLNSPTRDSVVGEFHLLNKYIKDLSNIPSGGIACAHASDSLGVAPTATWNFRTRKNSESMCLCVQNKNLITRIYHISRTASDMGLPQRTWRLNTLTHRMLIT